MYIYIYIYIYVYINERYSNVKASLEYFGVSPSSVTNHFFLTLLSIKQNYKKV